MSNHKGLLNKLQCLYAMESYAGIKNKEQNKETDS